MIRKVRLLLLIEGATFALAALIHFGVLLEGYEHGRAGTAESVIAVVLLGGALLTWLRPVWTRRIGLIAQGFALLGTLVGLFTVAIGVGPRTVPDIVYHILILALLAWGFMTTRSEPEA